MESFSIFQKSSRTAVLLDWVVTTIQAKPHIGRAELVNQCDYNSRSSLGKTIQLAIAQGLIKPDGKGGYVPLKRQRPNP